MFYYSLSELSLGFWILACSTDRVRHLRVAVVNLSSEFTAKVFDQDNLAR